MGVRGTSRAGANPGVLQVKSEGCHGAMGDSQGAVGQQ